MNRFLFSSYLILLTHYAQAQVIPHRMRVGLSLDVLGTTLGVGTQLHGSFRFTDDYRAFDDRHQYINVGVGIGYGFSGPLSMGQTIPHYLTYGIGRGRAMWEFGYSGVIREKLSRTWTMVDNPLTGGLERYWTITTTQEYLPLLVVGYRYTAYSGFMFRASGPIPGVALGWMF